MPEWTLGKVEPVPVEWQGRRVGLMDALLYARERVLKRHGLFIVTGGESIESLFHFTIGWASNTQFNGGRDQDWRDFRQWLDEVEPQARYEGWPVTFLRECDGDHERAIMKLLDRAHEFVTARRPPPRPDVRWTHEASVAQNSKHGLFRPASTALPVAYRGGRPSPSAGG